MQGNQVDVGMNFGFPFVTDCSLFGCRRRARTHEGWKPKASALINSPGAKVPAPSAICTGQIAAQAQGYLPVEFNNVI